MSWKTLMQLTIYSGMDRRKQAKHSNRNLEESRKPHQRLDLCLYQLPGGREIKHHHGNNRIVCVVNHLLCLEVNIDMGFYCAFSIVLYKITVITKCKTNILTPTFRVIWQKKTLWWFINFIWRLKSEHFLRKLSYSCITCTISKFLSAC